MLSSRRTKPATSLRQPAFAHGQPDGAAEQADADDGDFPKLHGGKDSGWKMVDGRWKCVESESGFSLFRATS